MAKISHAAVVAFSNQRTRVLADKLTQVYYAAKAYQTDYAAQDIGEATKAAADVDVLDDGSAKDGRVAVTKKKMDSFMAGVDALIDQFEKPIPGVGVSLVAIQSGISVNGSPR
jgi:hypothetical protein